MRRTMKLLGGPSDGATPAFVAHGLLPPPELCHKIPGATWAHYRLGEDETYMFVGDCSVDTHGPGHPFPQDINIRPCCCGGTDC